jgi:iron-sulfur cluster assembly protein
MTLEQMSEDPRIKVTPKAVEMGKKQLIDSGQRPLGLRLGVKGGGCSGYYYVYDVANKVRERDLVYDFDGLTVVMDNRSVELLEGATLDWEQKLLGYGFKWLNPNATGDCGCGASFTTD